MKNSAILFLACIFAGFALNQLPSVSFLNGMVPFFNIVGALAIILFSFALFYLGIKSLFRKP